jgi:hypothetical protein
MNDQITALPNDPTPPNRRTSTPQTSKERFILAVALGVPVVVGIFLTYFFSPIFFPADLSADLSTVFIMLALMWIPITAGCFWSIRLAKNSRYGRALLVSLVTPICGFVGWLIVYILFLLIFMCPPQGSC